METFAKRYFWTVGLALLALLALLNGKAVTNVLGTLLIPAPGEEKITIVKPPVRASAQVRKSQYVEARNVFNSAATAEELPDPDALQDEGELDPDQVPESDLGVTLSGTIYSNDPAWSIALVQDGPETRLFQVGQTIKADAELLRVWAYQIWVRRATGKIEKLVLQEAGAKKGRKRASFRGAGSKAPGSKSGGKSEIARLKEGIKRKSAYEYEIDRGMLEEQMSDLNKLGTQARIIPHYKDGKANGFKLVGIRPGSLYTHIGIRSGDVIRGVNGNEINSPTKALQVYEQLKNSSDVRLEIERRGQKKTIEYKIR